MKTRSLLFCVLLAGCFHAGCATSSEPTQKEKDRMARELERESERESRKRAQAQEKMMRGNSQTGLGGQRAGTR